MANFTHDELERIQKTLRKRYVKPENSDVLDIGFGVAYKFGAIDPRRGFSAIFYVREKAEPAQGGGIPDQVVVRLKRGAAFETIVLSTDTVATGGNSPIVPTGTLVEFMVGSEAKFVTAGAIVAWRSAGASTDIWGILTVGHGFDAPGGSGSQVVTVVGRLPGTSFTAAVIWKAPRSSTFDTAIVQVQVEQLLDAQLMTADQVSQSSPMRSLDELAADAQTFSNPTGSAGLSLSPMGPVAFQVAQYLPSALEDVFPELGGLRCVVGVRSGQEGAFMPGTSGSCWQILGVSSAIQVAGRAPHYVEGYGQAIVASFIFAQLRIESSLGADPDTFRLITTF